MQICTKHGVRVFIINKPTYVLIQSFSESRKIYRYIELRYIKICMDGCCDMYLERERLWQTNKSKERDRMREWYRVIFYNSRLLGEAAAADEHDYETYLTQVTTMTPHAGMSQLWELPHTGHNDETYLTLVTAMRPTSKRDYYGTYLLQVTTFH